MNTASPSTAPRLTPSTESWQDVTQPRWSCWRPEPQLLHLPHRTLPAPANPGPNMDALALWDDNGNGRITCAEARAYGIAPVRRGHPAYHYMRDADGDGVVCE